MTSKNQNRQPPLGGLLWPPDMLVGTLVKRYKRFLADVKLRNGHVVTAHCPNSGAMTTCAEPGRPVYISRQNSPKRKLKYTWELIDMPRSLVGVNTNIPNRLVKKAIADGVIPELTGYDEIFSEVTVGQHRSRLDLMLQRGETDKCYIEVKNCTLVTNGVACFPDAITTRGQKHLDELEALARQGHRCVMFFLVQRMDAKLFQPADHIDPTYGRKLREAAANGIEILVYDVYIDLEKIVIDSPLPYEF